MGPLNGKSASEALVKFKRNLNLKNMEKSLNVRESFRFDSYTLAQ